jgi:nicotinamide-nucleotide amidase
VQAEIITIGDEILIGQTIDTNAAFIAAQLNAIGVNVRLKRTIADRADAIIEALNQVRKETSLVFMTGGLGPTNDDITKKTLNEYFGGELIFNEEVFKTIEDIFRSFNRTPQEVHRHQAFLPSTASILINRMGTASGMHFQRGSTHFFSLPGVPYEAEHLVRDRVIPWILENLQKGTVLHRTLLTQGVPESDLAEMLLGFEKKLPGGISLAYLPSPGLVKLRLTSYDGDPLMREGQMDLLVAEMREILGDAVYGENVQTLEEVIGEMLRKRKRTLSMAESCTGGNIASRITRVAGASNYFKGSIVSYATEVKEEVLMVEKELVRHHGVVSEQVALAMADKSRRLFDTDYAISTTGIAGPDGGTEQNPVGSIWIGIAGPERTHAWHYRFGRNRERNIQKATLTALNLLRREIQKNKEQ